MRDHLSKKQVKTIREIADDFVDMMKKSYPQAEFAVMAIYPMKKSVAACSCGNCARSAYVESTIDISDLTMNLLNYIDAQTAVTQDVTDLAAVEPPTKAKH